MTRLVPWLALALSASGLRADLYPPLDPLWAFGVEGGCYSAPVLDNERLYVGGVGGAVYAVDLDGRQIWKRTLGGQVYAGVAVDERAVYAASTAKLLAALDRQTGEELWRQPLDGLVYATPRRVGDAVIVGTGDTGQVYAFAAADGQELWRFPLGGRLGSGIAAADGMVYLPSYDRHLYAVEVATGLLRWQFVAHGPLDSLPLVAGERLYLKLSNDRVYALNRADGKLLWSNEGNGGEPSTGPSTWSPLRLAAGKLFYGSLDGRLHAIDAETGREAWLTAPTIDRPAPPEPAGELGFAGGKDGGLEAINLANGRLVWSWQPPQDVAPGLLTGIMWPPVIAAGRLYASSLDGHLYAFAGLTDRAAWEAAQDSPVAPDRPVGPGWPANIPLLAGGGASPAEPEIEAVRELGRRVHGFVVWESNRDGAWDLFRIGTDGGGFRRLTSFAERRSPLSYDGFMRPRVSPDGRWVLFAYGRRRAPVEAWLVTADGGAPRKAADGAPLNWLADGSGFYLIQDSRLARYDLAAGQVTQVSGVELPITGTENDAVGGVTPDGRGLVIGRPGTVGFFSLAENRLTQSQTGEAPQLTADGWYQYWAAAPGDFQVMELRTGQARTFYGQPAAVPYTETCFPAVAIDQRWLLYAASDGAHDHDTADYEVFIQELDEWRAVGPPVRLSWHSATDRWPSLWLAP